MSIVPGLELALYACIVSVLSVEACRRVAQARRILDVPNARSSHDRPMPRTGGFLIPIVVLVALVVSGEARQTWGDAAVIGLAASVLLVAIVSLWDDVRTVSTPVKMAAHIAAAGLGIAAIGYPSEVWLPGVGLVDIGLAGAPLAVVWIVGLTNAYNFMDGIDGIAGLQAVVAGLGWLVIGSIVGVPLVGVLGALLGGVSLGFLVHNWPPARIFMGDVGSASLGFAFAVTTLLAGDFDVRLLTVGVLLLWPFLFDTSFTFLRRLRRGEHVFSAHRTHLYQRLVIAGYTHRVVTSVYGLLAALGLLCAWFLAIGGTMARGVSLCAVAASALILWRVVERSEKYPRARCPATPQPLQPIYASDAPVPILPRFNMLIKSAPSPGTSGTPFDGSARWLLDNRRPFIVGFHLVLAGLSAYCAIWLRFDGDIPDGNWRPWVQAVPILLLIRGIAFGLLGLYQGLWRYAGIWDLRTIVVAVVSSSVAFYGVVHWGLGWMAYPRSVIVIDSALLILVMGGVRMTRRLINDLGSAESRRNVIVYGAGDAGEMLVRDIKTKPQLRYRAIGFIDDDPAKVGQRIHGVPVLGTRDDLARIMAQRKPDEILLAIPGSDPAALRSVVRALDRYNLPIKTIPTLNDVLENRVEITRVRNLSAQDLLSRGPVGLDSAPLRHFLKGRRVLVTGAGGSIGAELCRQIVNCGAEALVLFERHENSLYHIVNDLADRGHSKGVHPIIGDVADAARVAGVLYEYRPEIIFHAAAHKHVPLMEWNACEAVKNNVTGTRLLMEAAERSGVDRFILISTDKAVNPTSVMGATKRVAELMLLTQGVGSGTSFMTVRFGNVLASSGSVVPRFLQQIKDGGPVTVTHPEMRRYFMLIPEAVQLVLHAAARGDGGKLYALEMGEQVKLADMARDLIRLAGFIPEIEIPVTFIGLRPGEKLYEELVGPDETTEPSGVNKVMRVKPLIMPVAEALARERARLEDAAQRNDTPAVLEHLGRLVPAFDRGRLEAAAPISQGVPTARQSSDITNKLLRHLCPDCSSPQVHRSHVRSRFEEWRKSFSQKLPYRCHVCEWRGWLLPWERSEGHRVAVENLLSPDFDAIDEAVITPIRENRSVFSPRDLPTP